MVELISILAGPLVFLPIEHESGRENDAADGIPFSPGICLRIPTAVGVAGERDKVAPGGAIKTVCLVDRLLGDALDDKCLPLYLLADPQIEKGGSGAIRPEGDVFCEQLGRGFEKAFWSFSETGVAPRSALCNPCARSFPLSD